MFNGVIESIDFHCFPDILEYVNRQTGIELSIIKSEIWDNNSKYNFRENCQVTKSDIWEKMISVVRNFQNMKKREIYIK